MSKRTATAGQLLKALLDSSQTEQHSEQGPVGLSRFCRYSAVSDEVSELLSVPVTIPVALPVWNSSDGKSTNYEVGEHCVLFCYQILARNTITCEMNSDNLRRAA